MPMDLDYNEAFSPVSIAPAGMLSNIEMRDIRPEEPGIGAPFAFKPLLTGFFLLV